TAKPVIDWEQDGKTGAVAELEGAVTLQHNWKLQLMLGGRLWGEGVPSTYGTRVELTLVTRFEPGKQGQVMAEMQRHDLTRVVLMVLFIGGLIAASFWILRPFIAPTIWAVMIV